MRDSIRSCANACAAQAALCCVSLQDSWPEHSEARMDAGHAVAKKLFTVIASPDEVPAPCQHHGRCGGCTLQKLAYAAQLEAKQSEVSECHTQPSCTDGLSAQHEEGPLQTLEYRSSLKMLLVVIIVLSAVRATVAAASGTPWHPHCQLRALQWQCRTCAVSELLYYCCADTGLPASRWEVRRCQDASEASDRMPRDASVQEQD